MSHLEPLMQRNFLEYASYVIVDRAIPDLRDGLKPVQRRILHTLFEMHDGKLHKVANVIGETMKLHPHGDASIGEALVVLANKEYFIEKQGNFGSSVTGHAAAAPRYIECRLTPLALETLFSPALTTRVPSYDGRREEPQFLPAKLPVVLLLGPEGIAVGMATRILPYNLIELLAAQVKILRKQKFEIVPDLPGGGLVDVSEYDDGRGKARIRAKIDARGEKSVVIREIPFGTTTESVIASIESAAQRGKVKIGSIADFTTDRVEIELALPRGVYADEVIPQLYAHTECEVSIASNIVIIRERHPQVMSASEVLVAVTEQLREQIRAELNHELEQLFQREHWLTLERIFIEKRVYKRIEKATTEEKVRAEVWSGMQAHAREFARPMVDADIDRLLEIRIRRISAWDIERYRKDLEQVREATATMRGKLAKLTRTTIRYLEELIERYRSRYPRRSKLTTFEAIDKKAVALQNIKVSYDPENGFFGSKVRGSEFALTVSEYDRILVISRDGGYRIIAPPEKFLVPSPAIYCDVFSPEAGAAFTVVYRDRKRTCYAKQVHIKKFIREKEYELIPGREGQIDLLLPGTAEGRVHLTFAKAPRQRLKEAEFDLATLEPTGASARGRRIAPKPVARVKLL